MDPVSFIAGAFVGAVSVVVVAYLIATRFIDWLCEPFRGTDRSR